MANRARGEAALTLADGRELTLVVDYGAFAEAEDIADKGINELLDMMRRGRLRAMQAIVCGALKANHPDISPDEVGDLLLGGDSAAIGKAVNEAVANAFPKEAAGKGDADPLPKGGAGKA